MFQILDNEALHQNCFRDGFAHSIYCLPWVGVTVVSVGNQLTLLFQKDSIIDLTSKTNGNLDCMNGMSSHSELQKVKIEIRYLSAS